MKRESVALIGASDDPNRFAYKAFKNLLQHGHSVFLVSPKFEQIEGHKVFQKMTDIQELIDTVTLYVGAKVSSQLKEDLLALKPKRVIFNPGAENPELKAELAAKGIQPQEDCTLILLSSNRF